MPFAPDWSGSASVTYEWDLSSSLDARFNIGAKYMSDYNTGSDRDPEKLQDAYPVVHAPVGIGSSDNSWSLALRGANIAEAAYVPVGFDVPLQILTPLPRPGTRPVGRVCMRTCRTSMVPLT